MGDLYNRLHSVFPMKVTEINEIYNLLVDDFFI